MVSSINGNGPPRRPTNAARSQARSKQSAEASNASAARLRGRTSDRVQAAIQQRLQDLVCDDAARHRTLPRILVEAMLLDQFGNALALEAGFQQLVDEVSAVVGSTDLVREDLDCVRRRLLG